MSQRFVAEGKHVLDINAAISNIKMKNCMDMTVGEFMVTVRAHLGVTGFNTLDPSRETELMAKIKKLETEKEEKAKEYEELLAPIFKEIEALKSKSE